MSLETLGETFITQWILSEDPLEGSLWEDVCAQLGLDPDVLAIEAEKARRMYSRLNCGHYDIEANVYTRYGRKQCRTCAAKRDKSEGRGS